MRSADTDDDQIPIPALKNLFYFFSFFSFILCCLFSSFSSLIRSCLSCEFLCKFPTQIWCRLRLSFLQSVLLLVLHQLPRLPLCVGKRTDLFPNHLWLLLHLVLSTIPKSPISCVVAYVNEFDTLLGLETSCS